MHKDQLAVSSAVLKMKLIGFLLFISAFSAFAGDLSLQPAPGSKAKVPYVERYRILVDLDDDGAKDLLLSGPIGQFGTMGGLWEVYFNRDGNYQLIGEIWAHPLAIAFEPDQSRFQSQSMSHRFTRIWVYLKSSGSAGAFGYYRVGRDTVDEMTTIEIYPGDGGTEIGRAIYQAAFQKSSIPYELQHSETTENGTVAWKEFKH